MFLIILDANGPFFPLLLLNVHWNKTQWNLYISSFNGDNYFLTVINFVNTLPYKIKTYLESEKHFAPAILSTEK